MARIWELKGPEHDEREGRKLQVSTILDKAPHQEFCCLKSNRKRLRQSEPLRTSGNEERSGVRSKGYPKYALSWNEPMRHSG